MMCLQKYREQVINHFGKCIESDFGLDFWDLDSITDGRLSRRQIDI